MLAKVGGLTVFARQTTPESEVAVLWFWREPLPPRHRDAGLTLFALWPLKFQRVEPSATYLAKPIMNLAQLPAQLPKLRLAPERYAAAIFGTPTGQGLQFNRALLVGAPHKIALDVVFGIGPKIFVPTD